MRNIFITFLNISLSVSILFLLLTLVDLVVKTRYSKHWKHLAFLLLGIRLVLPINLGLFTLPIIPAENTTYNQSQTSYNSDRNLEDPSNDSNNISTVDDGTKKFDSSSSLDSPNNSLLDSNADTTLHNKPQQKRTVSFSRSGLLNICIIIWLLGIIIFSIYHLYSYVSFNRKLKRYAKATNNNTYLDILKEQKAILHITRNIPLLIYDEICSPLLIGYGKPCIILPNNKYSKDQITFIIKHELTHYVHHDLYIKLLLVVSNAFHWFNPLIYILVKHASLSAELYCDESVTAKQSIAYREQYSLTLLQIMESGNYQSPALLSTGFSNNTKHMKERFRQIMNTSSKKKGVFLIILTICIILIGSNLATEQQKKSAHADTLTDIEVAKNSDNNVTTKKTKETENITNILVLGLDSKGNNEPDNSSRPDSILLITLNKEKNTVTINTILRDILVDIPGYDKNKIANAYVLGGEDLMKTTLNHNFGITIDHGIVMEMNVLETSIDQLGGTTITLSKVEAEYLNNTNYISKKSNRNVIEGSQHLNGNQTLGYLRIRHVPTTTGETNDYGRTKRLIQVLKSLTQEFSQTDLNQMLQLASTILPSIKTDMSLDDISYCLNTFLSSSSNMDYTCIPRFEDCTSSNENGMSVLLPDIEQSRELFSEYLQ